MKRRNFIQQCGALGAACIGLSALLQGCKSFVYIPNTLTANKITIRKIDFAQNKFVLVKNQLLQAPIYLLKLSENEYSAVLMLCTHKGCELSPAGSILVCPCHGSEFSSRGSVLSSPAQTDLLQYRVSTNQEYIFIQL